MFVFQVACAAIAARRVLDQRAQGPACASFVSPQPPAMDAGFPCARCGYTQAEHQRAEEVA